VPYAWKEKDIKYVHTTQQEGHLYKVSFLLQVFKFFRRNTSLFSIPLGKKYGRFIIGFYLFPTTFPFGNSTPSSHEMRYNAFLGQCTCKSQNMRR
jgi:hypothetical protein